MEVKLVFGEFSSKMMYFLSTKASGCCAIWDIFIYFLANFDNKTKNPWREKHVVKDVATDLKLNPVFHAAVRQMSSVHRLLLAVVKNMLLQWRELVDSQFDRKATAFYPVECQPATQENCDTSDHKQNESPFITEEFQCEISALKIVILLLKNNHKYIRHFIFQAAQWVFDNCWCSGSFFLSSSEQTNSTLSHFDNMAQ